MHESILRSIRGLATPDEEEAVRAWRADSPENEAVYRDIARLVACARELEASVDPGTAPSAGELIRRAATPMPDDVSVTPISSARRAAAGSTPARIPSVRRLRAARWLRRGAAAAALIALGLAVGKFLPHGSAPLAFGPEVVATGPDEMATVELRDGSVIRVAPASRLEISGSMDRREVRLDGRAFFAIAKLPDRPFRVRTAAGDAHVLGTRFDLAVRDDGLSVIVTEGRVALDADEKWFEVAAGEVGEVVTGRRHSVTRVADARALVDWTGKFLAFQDTPLDEAAREIERVYGARVAIRDSSLVGQTLSVWFADRDLDDVIAVTCMVLDAHCSIDGTTVTIGQ